MAKKYFSRKLTASSDPTINVLLLIDGHSINSQTAKALATLANDYQYRVILHALEPARQEE